MSWIPIGEPDIPRLSCDAEKVFSIMQGMDKPIIGIIRMKTRFGDDRIMEAIYEIRKMEAIRMGKLTNQQRAAIYQAWKDGTTQKELAKQYGVCAQAISQLCAKLAKAEQEIMQPAAEEKPKPGIINPEFDAAVNEMIAESKSVDAEEPAAIAETEKSSTDIPDYVLYAVDCRIADLEHRLQDFADQKAMLEHDLRRLQENIESVQDEHDKLADWKLEVDP
jgi:hypothetical protein